MNVTHNTHIRKKKMRRSRELSEGTTVPPTNSSGQLATLPELAEDEVKVFHYWYTLIAGCMVVARVTHNQALKKCELVAAGSLPVL